MAFRGCHQLAEPLLGSGVQLLQSLGTEMHECAQRPGVEGELELIRAAAEDDDQVRRTVDRVTHRTVSMSAGPAHDLERAEEV